jgi:predicted CXXCH cytochrome family protein
VENPDAIKPYASLDIPATLDGGCAECHSGNHHPFAEEWAMSPHASVVSHAAGNESCAGCHRGQGVLEGWGVDAEYIEKDSPDHMAITCGVCHDPHGSPNDAQLRFPINTPSAETHLCARCHNRRSLPDAGSSHGLEPHAPETALMLGDAGWFPPGLEPGALIATHGSEANQGLCASCHVNRFEVTDMETGAFVFQATGHLFTAIPCVDGDGLPMPGDCGVNTTERSFLACATTGCHGSPAIAAGLLNAQVATIQMWADDLMAVLLLADPGLETPGGAIDPTDPSFTVAEGALFNYNLALFGGDARGATAHNPFLTEGLLLASITAVEDTYGVRANPAIDYEREMNRLMSRAGR